MLTMALILGAIIGGLVGLVIPKGQAGWDHVVQNTSKGLFLGAAIAGVLDLVLTGVVH